MKASQIRATSFRCRDCGKTFAKRAGSFRNYCQPCVDRRQNRMVFKDEGMSPTETMAFLDRMVAIENLPAYMKTRRPSGRQPGRR